MKIEPGTIITVDVLRWDDGWDFDCPTLILRPVLKYFDNGESLDGVVEELGIDGCVDGEIKDEDIAHEFEWRGWKLKYFKKVFSEVLKGKNYPKRNYQALRAKIEFYKDKDGTLAFRDIK